MGWWNAFRDWLLGANSPEPRIADDQAVCRAATWDDVLMVAGLLERHGVKYVLVGGYALAANGLVRQTGDIDILVENSVENNARWITAMAELPDREAAVLIGEADPFPKDDGAYGDGEPGVIRIADEITVDVMPRACGLEYGQLEKNVTRIDGRCRAAGQHTSVLLLLRGFRPIYDCVENGQRGQQILKCLLHGGQ